MAEFLACFLSRCSRHGEKSWNPTPRLNYLSNLLVVGQLAAWLVGNWQSLQLTISLAFVIKRALKYGNSLFWKLSLPKPDTSPLDVFCLRKGWSRDTSGFLDSSMRSKYPKCFYESILISHSFRRCKAGDAHSNLVE
jgi:hypothetical protein